MGRITALKGKACAPDAPSYLELVGWVEQAHYSHAKRWLEKGTPSVLCRPHPSPNSADAPECSVPTIYTHGGRWKAPRGSGLSHVPHYDVPKDLWLDGYQTHAPLLINESVLSLPFKQHSLSLHPHQSEPQKGGVVRDRC